MSWFALTTPPQRELAAVAALKAHCEAFSPHEYVVVRENRSTGQKVVRPKPIFSRYVFARDPDFYTIRSLEIAGSSRMLITGVLSLNGTPYVLPQPEVLRMMHLATHGIPIKIPVTRGLHPGDVCRITGGPGDGRTVKVIRGENDAIVDCKWLGNVLLGKDEIRIPRSLLKVAA